MAFENFMYGATGIAGSRTGRKDIEKIQKEVTAGLRTPPEFNRRIRGQYFSGYKGLTAEDRAAWDQANPHAKDIDSRKKEIAFKNSILKSTLEEMLEDDPYNEELRELYNNGPLLPWRVKDMFMAEAFKNNPDLNDYKGITDRKSFEDGLNTKANMYLDSKASELKGLYLNKFNSLSNEEKEHLINEFDSTSNEVSGVFQQYNNSDKLSLSDDDKLNIIADYYSRANAVGQDYANERLQDTYNDIVANNQSAWEITINSGAQFMNSLGSNIFRAAGMMYGLMGGLFGAGKEKGEGYWANLLDNTIDNSVTQWADRITTTGVWFDPEEQKRLEELGLNDDQIFISSRNRDKIFHSRTVAELFGQYGFTAASTILSFGGSALVNNAVKGLGWLAKSNAAARGLNSTAEGMKIARGLVTAKTIGNAAVAGLVGTVEGGMNAAETKKSAYKSFMQKSNEAVDKKIDETIDKEDPLVALGKLEQAGYDVSDIIESIKGSQVVTPEQAQKIKDYIKSTPELREQYMQQFSSEIEENELKAKEYARAACFTDFHINSVINGLLDSSLKASLNAPGVQRALKKVKGKLGFNSHDSRIDDMLTLNMENGVWRATKKNVTKSELVIDRLKEALGEGLEEYSQSISSAFSEGAASNAMQAYLNAKYGGGEGQVATEVDFFDNLFAGITAGINTALSHDAIKEGVYGALSTLMGGANVNLNRGTAGRREGESMTSYLNRRSLISWRGAWTPYVFDAGRSELDAQRQAVVDRVNRMLSDKSVQEAIFNTGASAQWLVEAQKAIENGDEKAARDAEVGASMSNVMTLNLLQGTAYYDMVMATLNARANFDVNNLADPESTESKALAEYKSDTQNTDKGLTDEHAIERMAKNAKNMLDFMSSVEKATESIENLFGKDIDSDVKESLVFNKMMIDSYEKRGNQLDEELSRVSDAITDKTTSNIDNKTKEALGKYGTVDKIKAKKDLISRRIEQAEEQLKENISKKEKKALSKYIKQAKNELEKLDDAQSLLENYNKNSDKEVLTMQDIMNLPVKERSNFIKNKDKYSAKQQEEIDKLIALGTQEVDNFSDKIIDRGRIAVAHDSALQQQIDVLEDMESLNRYTYDIKRQYERLHIEEAHKDIITAHEDGKSYEEFVSKLENLDSKEFAVVSQALDENKSPYYERYKNEWQQRDKLLEEAKSRNEEMTKDEENALYAAFRYLQNLGIDIYSDDSVNTLSAKATDPETNEEYNPFARYLKEQEVGVSIGVAIQLYQDAMDYHNKLQEEKARNKREVPIELTTDKDKNPPNPNPAGLEESDDKVGDGDRNKSVSDFVKDNVESTATDIIDNAEGLKADKEEAKRKIGDVMKNFSSIENFVKSLYTIANSLESNSETGISNVATLLRAVASKIEDSTDDINKSSLDKYNEIQEKRAKTDNSKPDKVDANVDTGTEASNNAPISKDASIINTLDLSRILSKYPDGPIAKYIRKYKIEDFLRSAKLDNRTKVVFITDSNLNAEVQANMKDKYTADSAPIVVATEVSEKTETSIEIDGKYYQPISIMPASGATSRGSNHLFKLRTLGENNGEGVHLIKDGDNVVSTTLSRAPRARAKEGIVGHAPATSIDQILDNSMSDEDRAKLLGMPYEEKIKSPIYTAIRDKFIKALSLVSKVNEDGKEVKNISYAQKTLKTDKEATRNRFVKIAPINESVSPKTGKTIEQTINDDGSVGSIVNYNSKTQGIARSIKKIRDKIKKLDLAYVDGKLTPDSRKNLQGLQRDVIELLGKYLNVSNKEGYTYRIMPNDAGSFSLEIYNENTEETIKLADISGKTTNEQCQSVAAEVIKNTICERDANGRYVTKMMPDGIDSFAKWQVDRNDVTIANSDENIGNYSQAQKDMAMKNLRETVDDGILTLKLDDLNYSIGHLEIHSPFSSENSKSPTPTVTNSDNASSPAPAKAEGDTNTPKGTINSDLGVPTDDNVPKPESNTIDRIKDIVEKIKENSKKYVLDDTERFYNGPGGSIFHRVTSIMAGRSDFNKMEPRQRIQITSTSNGFRSFFKVSGWNKKVGDMRAKEDGWGTHNGLTYYKKSIDGRGEDNVTIWFRDEIPNKLRASLESKMQGLLVKSSEENIKEVVDFINENIENSYTTASTNIGTGIDRFVRDFFANPSEILLKDEATLESMYPNCTGKDLKNFAVQLKDQLLKSKFSNLKVIPHDVTVAGEMTVNGEKVKVAGTLDLLAYDEASGKFYIFDMKSHRSANTGQNYKKWEMQLSFYKKLLQDEYGVEVESLGIIPIKVKYPSPDAVTKYTAGKDNQLELNGKPFKGAKPKLEALKPFEGVTPSIDMSAIKSTKKSPTTESTETKSKAPKAEPVAKDKKTSFTSDLGINIDTTDVDKLTGGVKPAASDNIANADDTYSFEKYKEEIENVVGYTKEQWEEFSDKQREQELTCAGII